MALSDEGDLYIYGGGGFGQLGLGTKSNSCQPVKVIFQIICFINSDEKLIRREVLEKRRLKEEKFQRREANREEKYFLEARFSPLHLFSYQSLLLNFSSRFINLCTN